MRIFADILSFYIIYVSFFAILYRFLDMFIFNLAKYVQINYNLIDTLADNKITNTLILYSAIHK